MVGYHAQPESEWGASSCPNFVFQTLVTSQGRPYPFGGMAWGGMERAGEEGEDEKEGKLRFECKNNKKKCHGKGITGIINN